MHLRSRASSNAALAAEPHGFGRGRGRSSSSLQPAASDKLRPERLHQYAAAHRQLTAAAGRATGGQAKPPAAELLQARLAATPSSSGAFSPQLPAVVASPTSTSEQARHSHKGALLPARLRAASPNLAVANPALGRGGPLVGLGARSTAPHSSFVPQERRAQQTTAVRAAVAAQSESHVLASQQRRRGPPSDAGTHASWWMPPQSEASFPETAVSAGLSCACTSCGDSQGAGPAAPALRMRFMPWQVTERHDDAPGPRDAVEGPGGLSPSEAALWASRVAELEAEFEQERVARCVTGGP
jgi:hypothetical protein